MTTNSITCILRDDLIRQWAAASSISYDNSEYDPATGLRVPDQPDVVLRRQVQAILQLPPKPDDPLLVGSSELHLIEVPKYQRAGRWLYPAGENLTEEVYSMQRRKLRTASRKALAKTLGRCPYDGMWLLNKHTGERVPFNCKSWECTVCGPKLQAKYAIRFAKAKPEWFCTITSLSEDSAETRLAWQHFIRALRDGYGFQRASKVNELLAVIQMINELRVRNFKHPPIPEDVMWAAVDKLVEGYHFEYVRVLERGSKGGHKLHFHLMVRGDIPPEVVLGAVANMLGFGYVCDVTQVRDHGASWYISKYLTKEAINAPGRHKVSASRGFYLEKWPKPPEGLWSVYGTGGVPYSGRLAASTFTMDSRAREHINWWESLPYRVWVAHGEMEERYAEYESRVQVLRLQSEPLAWSDSAGGDSC